MYFNNIIIRSQSAGVGELVALSEYFNRNWIYTERNVSRVITEMSCIAGI